MTFNALVINNIISRVVPATGNIVNDCTFTNDPIGFALIHLTAFERTSNPVSCWNIPLIRSESF